MAFGDIGDFVGSTFKEVGHHPLQALGAALGVPGYDPFFGGLFNNHKGGALLSPTGNFSSSAWDEMYKDNPNSTAGLDLFHKVNKVADVVAPMIAGAYGAGSAFGGGNGISGLLGSSGGGNGVLGGAGSFGLPESIEGGGPLTGVTAGLGSGTADASAFGVGTSPYAGLMAGQAYPFSMSGSGIDYMQLINQLGKLNQQQQQQQQQNQQQQQSQTPRPFSGGGAAYGAAANGGNSAASPFPLPREMLLG
ncbi:MAG TPA: hypothetical protein VJ840_18565 [Gemmatimonadaceae bacterium]|nr:hypothetical protein [Gemmatimonadaceae bacterium]